MDPDANEDDLMAQVMGFSSFGAQNRPQKKRRYNPRADAVKEAPPSSTGANSMALGAARPATNTDEIDLDDDDETASPSGPQASLGSGIQAQVRPASLPERPAPGTGFVGDSGHQQQRPASHDHGSRDIWYEGYYDNTSNENPWERLEQAKGLEPKGSWLPRGSGVTSRPGP